MRAAVTRPLRAALGRFRRLVGPPPPAAPARRTLVLHIGMGKTGTTAIQTAMWANRLLLRRHGVSYPRIGVVSTAHHLVSPRCPPFLAHTGWRFLGVDEWAPRLARTVAADRIVMSSELIAYAEPGQVADFCGRLGDIFDLRVCLYLRRQDNSIMASYNQMIRAGTQTVPIERSLDRQIEGHDYLRAIWPWERALGAGNVIVAPYERGQFRNGDLLDDFLFRAVGIDRPEGFVAGDANPNPRLSPGALEYKRHINVLRRDPGWSKDFNPILARYCEGQGSDSHAIFHEHDLLGPEQRARVMRIVGPGNAYIARKFLGREDGRLFEEDIPVGPGRKGQPDPSGEFAAISALIAAEAPALFEELRALVAGAGSQGAHPLAGKAAEELGRSFPDPGPSPAEARSREGT